MSPITLLIMMLMILTCQFLKNVECQLNILLVPFVSTFLINLVLLLQRCSIRTHCNLKALVVRKEKSNRCHINSSTSLPSTTDMEGWTSTSNSTSSSHIHLSSSTNQSGHTVDLCSPAGPSTIDLCSPSLIDLCSSTVEVCSTYEEDDKSTTKD